MREPGPEGLDLLGPDFLADPYPYYRFLREYDPVHRTRQGSWLLTRHTMQVEAFSNPALGNAPSHHAVIHPRNAHRYTSANVAQNILPFLDRPQQIRPRRIVGSAFRAAMREMTADLEAEASDLLRRQAEGGRFDLIADFAEPLSVRTISRLMGLPNEDAGQLSKWAAQFFYLFAPMPSQAAREATDTALDEFRNYLRAVVNSRRTRMGNDVVSRLLLAEDDDGRLNDDQVVDNCMLLFADGVENVDRGLANTIVALHQHPDEWFALQASPNLAKAAVIEGLRFDPPAQMIGRVAREDLELGGNRIRKDTSVMLGTASANRDLNAYPEPDRFRIDRPENNLLTFGRGRHSCIGAPLVQLQMEAALRAIICLARKIDLDPKALEWQPRLGHRWLKALPVRVKLN